MDHELTAHCEPRTVFQTKSCDGTQHAMHRELTGKVLYYCNCGYASGWQNKDDMVPSTDFINGHLPPWRVQR